MRLLHKILLWIAVVCIVVLGTLIIFISNTFGNYSNNAYIMIWLLVIWLLYVAMIPLVYALSKSVVKAQKVYLLFLVPVLFSMVSYINGQNFHKNVVFEGQLDAARKTKIILFDNNTFAVVELRAHTATYIKGTYAKNGRKVVLTENNSSRVTNNLYSGVYEVESNLLKHSFDKR